MAKVSVIIPVYNVEKYLRQCLDSVVKQTLQDIEIICVDDGSTDSSLIILREYALRDARFIILVQNNQGAAAARNRGLEIATGEHIGFVDSDDYIDKSYFEILYKSSKNNRSDIAMTDNVLLQKCNSVQKKNCGVNKKVNIIKNKGDKANIIISTGLVTNKIYKKSFIDKNRIRFGAYPKGEDNVFTAISIIKSNCVSVCHNAKYYYVQHAESLVHQIKDYKDFYIINVYKDIDSWIDKDIDISPLEKSYWHCVNNKRKRLDFNCFLNTMNSEYKEEFSKLIQQNATINGLIISLTSYPARIFTVYKAIESLLKQTVRAEKIILWLSHDQFPNKEKDLPQQLLDLVPKGLIINWCNDIKSYKKLIPALEKFSDKIIITIDDDIIYDENSIKSLVENYINYPNCIIANRVRYITFSMGKMNKYNDWYLTCKYDNPSFNLFLTGAGGVLYPPNCFYKDVLNDELFMKLTKNTDDIWFWAMAVLNGTKIKLAKPNFDKLNYIDGTQDLGLYHHNCGNGNNDNNIKLILKHYPQILRKLDKISMSDFKILQNIFSVRNVGIRKVVTVFGINFKFKSKKLMERERIRNFESRIAFLTKENDINKRKLLEIASSQNKISIDYNNIQKNINNDLDKMISGINKKFLYKLYKYCPDNKYNIALSDWYYEITGQFLNLLNPQTFNEKIQWLKLYDATPLKTRLADKYLVRDWIKEKIGEEYLVPILGVWDNFDEINFDKLPDKFVLKCNHGSGYNIIVTDKSELNINDARKKINNWMQEDFAFRYGFELHYSKIPRKIIAEKFLDEISDSLFDYRFICSYGKCLQIWLDAYSGTPNHRRTVYDKNWNELDIKVQWPKLEQYVERPSLLSEMISLAEILSKDFSFVRVDFYFVNNKIYFGEMTFTSMSGTGKFEPENEDLLLGKKIKLPIND